MEEKVKSKSILKEIWSLRHLSVEDFTKSINTHPDLKFLLTTAGIWYLTKLFFYLIFTVNILYFVYRVFCIVLA